MYLSIVLPIVLMWGVYYYVVVCVCCGGTAVRPKKKIKRRSARRIQKSKNPRGASRLLLQLGRQREEHDTKHGVMELLL